MFAFQTLSAQQCIWRLWPLRPLDYSQINVKDYIHEQGAEGSVPAWEWESCGIFAFTEECVSLAQNDWWHIPLKSSFCFMRCIAAGARSMMFCVCACCYRRHWITDSISMNLECSCSISAGCREKEAEGGVKKVGEERSVWRTGIIDWTAWKSVGGRLSVCAATPSINFHFLSAVWCSKLSRSESDSKGGVSRLATRHVPLYAPNLSFNRVWADGIVAAVTEPIHNNNRAREDDEAGPDTRGMMQGWPEHTLKTDLLCLPLRKAAVDICCLRVGGNTSSCILT